MDPEPYVGIELDAAAIKVLAHPLRSRLLSRLRTRGPATATELAATLHTNSGATSYHLRKLESVGLVADTGEGQGKRRLWRAATSYHSWTRSAFLDDEDTSAALGWLERDYVRQFAEQTELWLAAAPGWPTVWVDELGIDDGFVHVTPAQLHEMRDRLAAVVADYRTAGVDDGSARRISVLHYARPVDLDPPGPAES